VTAGKRDGRMGRWDHEQDGIDTQLAAIRYTNAVIPDPVKDGRSGIRFSIGQGARHLPQ